jgi:hypothetical protein
MKKIVKCFLVFIGVIFSVAFLCSQSWAMSLSFSPSSASIGVGESIDIGIVISGLENADLGAFDFSINYDSTILGFNSYTLGDGLGDIAAGDADDWSLGDDGAGAINLAEISWLWDLSSQSDAFTLATISFTGIGAGTSPLLFSNVTLGDYWGDPLTATSENGSARVTAPVPVPATIFLMVTGLAWVFGFSRKKFFKTS